MPVNRDEASKIIEVFPEPPSEPQVPRRGWLNEALGAVLLIGVSFLLVGTALTVGRFSGDDFAGARRTGTATIERCTLRGPVTLSGFGYHDRCTVSVKWNLGGRERVTIDKPGFFEEEERAGDIVTIGENGSGYSRPELPERPWVTTLAWIIGLLGLLPLVAAGVYLRQSVNTPRS